MKLLRVGVLIVLVITMSGCAEYQAERAQTIANNARAEQPLPQPAPQRPLTFEEHCAALMRALGNPWIDPWQKSALYEKGRNDGCMGTPAPSPK